MKFNFKIQQFQTDAVAAVVDVFKGQGYHGGTDYVMDIGRIEEQYETSGQRILLDEDTIDSGFKNEQVLLDDTQLLDNIHAIQDFNNIKHEDALSKALGRCSIDVEMETGTGKTYVYIKTIFEMNKQYGWSKFIVVVPSIAIREGVKKSFEMTVDHFMESYGKKARYFIYSSSNLNQLDTFSSDAGINVMIINAQAFAKAFKEEKDNKETRIIYSKRDEFASRRPIDVIKANHPILILDEPQKLTGGATQSGLKNFAPLFSLNYSATHKEKHNLVYVLDALDAFKKKLVKKIQVKGFEMKNLQGVNRYLFLEDIIVSKDQAPRARLEFEVKGNASIRRQKRVLNMGDDLYALSNNLEEYRGCSISEIDPIHSIITFTNEDSLRIGEVSGDVSEEDIRRIQIRETIESHFEKEEELYKRGIKTLSLFFIDEVAKYRQYDEAGNEVLGPYGKIFEEEYNKILGEHLNYDSPYQKYLRESCADVATVHRGYFSIDKKGRAIDSTIKRGQDSSDDISAYDLILKNKERLLSFEEPTRFIFSHSALREGWDNPNVFQICTLKHSDSTTLKRQEVGRGLRLCVNKDGNRMDEQVCGDMVQKINMLTVVANESYAGFVDGLQDEMKQVLHDRPTEANIEYFEGKNIICDNGDRVQIDHQCAEKINRYLIRHDYTDDNNKITDKYRIDVQAGTLEPLGDALKPMTTGIHKLIQAIYDDNVLKEMVEDGNTPAPSVNALNDNFYKQEFKNLWNYINHKYAYTVEFDSNELIEKSVASINTNLNVATLRYLRTVGEQSESTNRTEVEAGESFTNVQTERLQVQNAATSRIKYDLVGKIAENTILTRKTVAKILKGIVDKKFAMFAVNPEEFINKVSNIINEQKATIIVDHVSYNPAEGSYDTDIFTARKYTVHEQQGAFKANKAIQDYVYTDGYAADGRSVERRFAEDLDAAAEVCVYAKLPKGFQIPTPVGNYAPDWAIAFNEGSVKHIYFVAETKGTMDSMQLKPIEQAKISCAKKLFNKVSTSQVHYECVDSYENLLNIMNGEWANH